MPGPVRYFPNGVDRDSYISGVRPQGKFGAAHDVYKRRDNLPDNVFNSIRDEVLREERLRLNEEGVLVRARLTIANGKGGKKMLDGDKGNRQGLVDAMEQITQNECRHQALKNLYKQDREEWTTLLASRGLSFE
ncbi:unnamed protein product [Phytomonas sp. Hart1]|nr:unnamed protein product [Phytomonas sp. Hart1]|eukprot:CCW69770.1 unnamed protein product [Phytomonas sp. isolate Hart1]